MMISKRTSFLTGIVFLGLFLSIIWTLLSSRPPILTYAASVTESVTDTEVEEGLRFAIVGDYGTGNSNESRVAELVRGWNPDFIITAGDNNYPDGSANTIDKNIGQFYQQFIGNYQGKYGAGSETNRFWPALGNHDWHSINCNPSRCTGPFFDYFTLPGNERFYDVDLGLVHLFAVDSYSKEPDGNSENSAQANWLQNALSASQACFNIVYFHHPPYSSGRHGSYSKMQWPFHEWGADVVIAGHDHTYERIEFKGLTYFVNGTGGAGLYPFDNLGNLPSGAASNVRYNRSHGAMLVTANGNQITYEFFNVDNELIDTYTTTKDCGLPVNQMPIVDAGSEQAITLPDHVVLEGAVSDDGLPDPPATVTTTWSMTSGPGMVTFTDNIAVDTTASFSVAGTYVLRLTANDGELVTYDEVTVKAKEASSHILNLYLPIIY